jgi:hypothetical protein
MNIRVLEGIEPTLSYESMVIEYNSIVRLARYHGNKMDFLKALEQYEVISPLLNFMYEIINNTVIIANRKNSTIVLEIKFGY